MFLLLLIPLFLLSSSPIRAQAGLYYQLIESYHPVSEISTSTPTITTPTPTPSPLPTSYGKTITITVLGDSMIDTLNQGLPQLKYSLAQYFPGRNFRILNYGVGGRDIEYGLYRLTNAYDYRNQHYQSLISQNPDIVVIESFAYNNFGNTPAGLDHYQRDLNAVVSTLKTQLPQVRIIIAATIAPNSKIFGNGITDLTLTSAEKSEKSSTIRTYLQTAINFATSQHLPLADAYHLSLFNNEGLKTFINTTDHLHPSGSGGQFFCDTLADTIYKYHLLN
jgi:lysophospholipase L1-like esterase